ncbi:MAG: MBL fold metallo-hydrolase [Alphaproteobacteria bacterium]|nr:MBL fold metallo-hydrolase [Alphaproteobacteria bacterium]
MVSITFLGATETVTGSKYLVECSGKKILVDCGLFQGLKELRLRNWDRLPIDPRHIDAVILTHAHLDHSGYLPLLVKQGFRGKVFATPATRDLCKILLPDSGYIQESDAERANRYHYTKHHPAKPLYTKEDAEDCLQNIEAVDYGHEILLGEQLSFHYTHVGHILGAAFITLKTPKGTMVFSGDIGRANDPLLLDPEYYPGSDYLVMESTYGNRLHDPLPAKDQLADVINQTTARGGSIIIPSFAVGRAQLLLLLCDQLKQEGRIHKDLPVFLDSPMAVDVTNLMQTHRSGHKLTNQECAHMCKTATYINTKEESISLDQLTMPAVIISASGMATGGRVLHHLVHFAPDPKNTILLAGFQATGTRGERLQRGEKEIRIYGQMIPVRAKVEVLDNVSAHADYEELLAWLSHAKKAPKQVFITHGEKSAAESFKAKVEARFGWHVDIPIYQETFTL